MEPQQGTWPGGCQGLEDVQVESRGLNLPKLANFIHLTCSPIGGTELSLITLEALPLSDPESAVPHEV